LDPASQASPRTWREIHEWGSLCIERSPEFVDAHRKLYSYFNTRLKFASSTSDDQQLSSDEERNLSDMFEKKLNYSANVLQLGISVAAYGSQIVTIQRKCQRKLVCPHPECGAVIDMLTGAREMKIDFRYDYNSCKFLYRCPAEGCPNRRALVPAIVKDWYRKDIDSLTIKQWPPDEMLIDYYLWTDTDDIYWRIPEYYKQAVRRGHLETLAEADLDVLKAIRGNNLFRFYRDRVFHAKEMSIAGLGLRGRGLPRSLLLGPQIYMLQVFRHQNQILGMDYLLPMGIFSLDDTPKGVEYSGPQSSLNLGQFSNDINRALAAHREDPTQRFAFPYALRYQIVGGEASQLAPVQLIENSKADVYEGAGVPLEMWRGSLSIQVMPVAARLYEASHKTIPTLFNRFAGFVAKRVSEDLERDPFDAYHEESTIVADIQKMAVVSQGVQLGHTSRGLLYESFGIDSDIERDRRIDELLADARAEQKLQKKLESEQLTLQMQAMPQPVGAQDPTAAQQGGQAPESAMPPNMAPSQGLAVANMSIQQLGAEAERIAAQLIDPSLPQAQVNQQLAMVKSQSPELHSLVRQAMDKMRQQAAAQGQHAVLSGQV
jgi:hypothetical protein